MPRVSAVSPRKNRIVLIFALAVALVLAPLTGNAARRANAAVPAQGTTALSAAQIKHLSDTYAITPKSSSGATHNASFGAKPADSPGTLQKAGGVETPRGYAITEGLPGTGSDWVRIHVNGTVARMRANGRPVWQRSMASLFADWKPTWLNPYQTFPLIPTMFYGSDPFDPLTPVGHAYAIGDLNGDHVGDIAVAYNVGYQDSQPFHVGYSQLSSGTFVDVLDGRDGHTVWFHLFPGIVTQLLTNGTTLIVGDDTGPDWQNNPVPEQGNSRSSLTAYRFLGGWAHRVWTYNTHAPWANWQDMTMAGNGLLAASWSDTPLGLGTPRPPAAHVLALDASTGQLRWDVETPEYPRTLRYDAARNALITDEQNDPSDSVRFDLTRYDLSDGHRSVLATVTGQMPSAFTIDRTSYTVSGITTDDTGALTSSVVTSFTSSGAQRWSYTLPAPAPDENAPAVFGLLATNGRIIVVADDPVHVSEEHPDGNDRSQLIGLTASSGAVAWAHTNAAVGSQLQAAAYGNGVLTMASDDTAYVYRARDGQVEQIMPVLGDIYAAVAYDVNGDGTKDLIVGGQSRGVFALDGKALLSGQEHVLWEATVAGPVRQLQLADTDGRPELVVAATFGAVVLHPNNGSTAVTLDTHGQYVPVVEAGDLQQNGRADLVIPTGDVLRAYSGDTGLEMWSYQRDGVGFAEPAIDADGRVLVSDAGPWTGSPFDGQAAVPPEAVGIDGATGNVIWKAQPDPSTDWTIQPLHGVYWSPAIPGTDGHTVAFAWRGRSTVVELRDDRTGAVLTSASSGGFANHRQFLADPSVGLVELQFFSFETIFNDLSNNDSVVIPSLANGAFATAPDGQRVLLTAGGELLQQGGICEWTLDTLRQPPYSYPSWLASRDDYYSGNVIAADLTGTGSDLAIGFQSDLTALTIAWQLQGSDVFGDWSDPEPHGIVAYQLQSPGSAAGSSTAQQPAAQPATPDLHAPALHTITAPGVSTFAAITTDHVNAPGRAVPATAGADDIPGYTPAQINGVFNLTGDGAGQTVAIVDAYGSPTITSDVNTFSAQFGLPQTCDSIPQGTDCFNFSVQEPQGTPPVDVNWAEETSLDVEWVHAVAPKASIVLIATMGASAAELYGGISAAAALHPAAISNSWGGPEFSEESFYYSHCQLKSSVCLFSTGDAGYPTSAEAANPYSVSVGGTTLQLDSSGNVASETAWSDSGGGASYFQREPSYQRGVQRTGFRGTPDVSFDANPQTGVAVYFSTTGRGLWLQVGGTSLSAPVWAAITTVADQLRKADHQPHLSGASWGIQQLLYGAATGSLADVTSGSNGACGAQCTAGPGYDFVTGLGSPRPDIDVALAGRAT